MQVDFKSNAAYYVCAMNQSLLFSYVHTKNWAVVAIKLFMGT